MDMTSYRNRTQGLTLIELLVVVVIVGILAGVAYPSYRRQVIKSNRTEAKVELMQITGRLEKCYTRAHTYAGCLADEEYTTASGNYGIAVQVAAGGQTYLLSAQPQGGQSEDTTCGTLTLDETGLKKERGTDTVDPAKKCW
jgi:type IV pilus assembly protein PilE